MNEVPYTYVLVRQDIPVEHQMVQACHAALEAGYRFQAPAQTSHLVLCSVKDEAELLGWSAKLKSSGIAHEMFFEPDNSMGYSAIATLAITCSQTRKILSKLKLLRVTPVQNLQPA